MSNSLRLARPLWRLLSTDRVACPLLGIDHRCKKGARGFGAPVAQLFEREREPSRLHLGQPQRQSLAVRGRVELASSPVQSPGPDLDEVLVIRKISRSSAIVRPGRRLTK